MNKIFTLCFGILIITLPFSTQQKSSGNTTAYPSVGQTDTPVPKASTAGFGLMPTALCLLIPAATLGFIHSRS